MTATVAEESLHRERHGLVIYDRGTVWICCYPVQSKSADDTQRALLHFAGNAKVDLFYSDNSPELLKAVKEIGWPHASSTPGIPQSNRVAQRAVRRVLEGNRNL